MWGVLRYCVCVCIYIDIYIYIYRYIYRYIYIERERECLYKNNKLIFRLILIIIIYSLKCFGVEMYGAPTWYFIEKCYRDQNKNLFLHFILIVVLLYESITLVSLNHGHDLSTLKWGNKCIQHCHDFTNTREQINQIWIDFIRQGNKYLFNFLVITFFFVSRVKGQCNIPHAVNTCYWSLVEDLVYSCSDCIMIQSLFLCFAFLPSWREAEFHCFSDAQRCRVMHLPWAAPCGTFKCGLYSCATLDALSPYYFRYQATIIQLQNLNQPHVTYSSCMADWTKHLFHVI